ncbi:MAG: hypothetical protein Q9161_001685 [Pseudevernia consocians]
MARTTQTNRRVGSTKPPATIPAASPASNSKLPAEFRFPLLVVLSLTISSFLYSFVSPFTSGDLATVSRSRDNWWEIGALLGWKATQLAVGWYGGFDSTDFAALTFLTHLPYHYFLSTFYQIRPTTSAYCIAIDTLTAYVPFYSLKVSSSIHSIKTPKGVAANRSVINDTGVQIYTSLLAAGIYTVVVFSSYGTWLPVYLVTHFDGMRDISAAYNPNFPWLILSFLPTGFAAKVFLFTPATAAKADKHDKETAAFNPETATLGETVAYNLWGYSHRARILMKRTATLVAMGGAHTILQTYGSLEGAEFLGAAGWSSVWGLAATLTGAAFLWVGDVDGV